MKKAWKLVLCLALAVAMLSCMALAADAPEVAKSTDMADGAITVAADGAVTVTVPAAMVKDGNQYVVILAKVDAGDKTAQQLLTAPYELGESTILYIDQNAASSGVTFTGKPKSLASCVVLLGGTDASGADISARVLGAIKTQGVTVTGTVTAKGATSAKVELMDGTTAVVSADVTLTNGTGTYTLEGAPVGEYTLKVTSGTKYVAREYAIDTAATTEQNVAIAAIGDVNADGAVNVADYGKVLLHYKSGAAADKLTDYAFACGDTKAPKGALNVADYGAILAHYKGTVKLW